jgi:hypothetical protein
MELTTKFRPGPSKQCNGPQIHFPKGHSKAVDTHREIQSFFFVIEEVPKMWSPKLA